MFRSSTKLAALLATTSWFVFAADSAWAQEPQVAGAGGTEALAESSEGSSDTRTLNRVVVTAQRREQDLQDVPIAISVASADSLKEQGITATSDLQQLVPGLIVSKSGTGVQPILRGVGENLTSQVGVEPSVPIYIDGVYVAAPSALFFSFNNIERLEVLKGPQGTLFGRNASAGLIQVVTKDPEPGFGGSASVGFGNYDAVTASAYVSGGTDRVAGSLALYARDQSEGWGKNLFDPATAPPLLVNGVEVPYPAVRKEAGTSKEYGLQAKIVGHSKDDLTTIKLSYMHTKTDSDQYQYRHPIAGTVGTNGSPGASRMPFVFEGDFYDYNSDVEGEFHPRLDLFTADVSHDAGLVTIRSISSYLNADNPLESPSDFSPFAASNRAAPRTKNRAFTQELQLLSNDGEGPDWLSWIVGLYYLDGDASYDPLTLFRGNHVETLLEIFGSQNTKSQAVYAQADFDLTPTTTLTAGIRYTSETIRVDQSAVGRQDPSPVPIFSDGTLSGFFRPQEETFNKPTWRLALSQELTPNVSAYISQSRGFKTGGYAVGNNCLGGQPAGMACIPAPPLKPETLDATEVGVKAELFDSRLRANLSAYYYDYKGLQLGTTQTLIIGGVERIVPVNVNAAAAEIYGLEADIAAQITSNFNLTAGVSLLDSEYSSFPVAIGFAPLGVAQGGGNSQFSFDASGNTLVRAPEFTSTVGANWTIPTRAGPIDISGNWSHTGSFFWDPENRVKQESYDLFNAQIAFSPSDSWTLRLWGKNLGSEEYYIFVTPSSFGDQGAPAAPQTYGVSLDWSF